MPPNPLQRDSSLPNLFLLFRKHRLLSVSIQASFSTFPDCPYLFVFCMDTRHHFFSPNCSTSPVHMCICRRSLMRAVSQNIYNKHLSSKKRSPLYRILPPTILNPLLSIHMPPSLGFYSHFSG